jgi:hypothetical protein
MVEMRGGGGGDNGGDNLDQGGDENLGMEEIDPEGDLDDRKQVDGKSGGKSNTKQNPSSFSSSGGGRKVMDWISLFQDRKESRVMENSELAQYSCTKLLREMEVVADSDSEEQGKGLVECCDNELVQLPKRLVEMAMEIDSGQGLPENLYDIPDMKENSDKGESSLAMAEDGGVRERWGPVLVEKRLSRRNQDRRSVLEKAQDRKKLVNLEGGKGNSKSYHSSNVLSNDEISNIAREVGVCLDKN